jgi:YesN/AraC family two-component response regulator
MNLFIKNMVGSRCKVIVESEFKSAGLICTSVELGRIQIAGNITREQAMQVGIALQEHGLELLDNKRSVLVERIRQAIIESIHSEEAQLKTNFSAHLSVKLNLDYTYMANVFSVVQGVTIKQYVILQKIQFVKQLISLNELSLTEISWKLHYSSVAHLSTQFKKVTGITPSHFKLACEKKV